MMPRLKNTDIVLVTFFAIVIGAFTIVGFMPRSAVESEALRIVRSCSGASYTPACYDQEIPLLMDKGFTLEEAFSVTRIVQEKDGGYFYCHVLGHKLAEKETAKDPKQWTEVVARCPTGMCSNGCVHGAAQERFRSESLSPEQINDMLPELSQTCENGGGRHFTELERASCYHSLGHLAMYISDADINVATNVCDKVANKSDTNYVVTCYEGAYMQIFQPLEPEDFGLVRHIPATTTALAQTYCDSFSGERRAACHRESWVLYRDTLLEPGNVQKFCERASDATTKLGTEGYCYNSLFYITAAQLNFNAENVATFCGTVPSERKEQCFANSASRFIETDYRLAKDAVRLCTLATERAIGEGCFNELLRYSTFNFHIDSPDFNAFCATLPEPWRARCVNGEGANIEWGQYW